MIAMKAPPITNSSVKTISSSISITFSKRSVINENKLMMEEIEFSSMKNPVKFAMTLDSNKVNPSA